MKCRGVNLCFALKIIYYQLPLETLLLLCLIYIRVLCNCMQAERISSLSSSGSLPTRQVQMFDVAIPLVVELVLSAFYILPPLSSPASFVLVFLLIFFLSFSLRLPFLTVILLLERVRSTSFVWFLLCVNSVFIVFKALFKHLEFLDFSVYKYSSFHNLPD